MAERAANNLTEVDKALHEAASEGHFDIVEYLVGQGAQIDKPTENGETALFLASRDGHVDVVKYLVGQGAQVEKGDNNGRTPLLNASQGGHLDVVQHLVSHGAEVDMGDNDGETSLHAASEGGHIDIVKYLVSQGAQVEKGNNEGWTPLINASHAGHLDVVHYLVSQGAHVASGNDGGATPLHFASEGGHIDIVKYLVSQGAQVEKGNNKGWTPLINASHAGHLDVVHYLVSQGAHVDSGNYCQTPLHAASMNGQLDVVKFLVGQGAQIERGNNSGTTPLIFASFNDHINIVEYLVSKGAQVERGNIHGETPLHNASHAGHLDVVQHLVSHGAEVDRADNDGETPLHAASSKGQLDLVKFLVGQGAQIERGDNDGKTPLIVASRHGHLDVVQYLASEQEQMKEASSKDSEPKAKRLKTEETTESATDDTPSTSGQTHGVDDVIFKVAETISDDGDLRRLGLELGVQVTGDDTEKEGNDDQLTYLEHDSGSNRGNIPFGGLSALPEILARGPRAQRAYAEAAQAGTKKVFRTRLMLVGQERVGKTSLKKTLTRQRFDQNEAITNGVETTNACEICIEVAKAGEKMWSIHKQDHGNEDTKDDEYSKALADDIAKRLIVSPPQDEESLEPHNDNTRIRGLNPEEAEDEYVKANVDTKAKRISMISTQDEESLAPHSDTTLARGLNPVKAEGFVLDKVEAPQAKEDDENMPNKIASLVAKMLTEQVHLKEIGTDRTDSGRGEGVSLSIWDFAGHDIYYTTHQAKGGAKSELTCLEFINFWLCSIFAHAVAPSSVKNNDTSTPTQKSPPIFIVGTHRESVQGNAKEKKEKIGCAFKEIRESIMKRPFECHVVPKYYAIENSLEDKDEELVALRRHIEKVAIEEPYMGEEIPLRWLLFEEALAADQINYMTLDQTKKLTQPVGMESEGELFTMLTFYHDLGYIVYYGGIEDKQSLLKDMVILNPQWLIDVFKQVITILDPAEMDGIVSDAWATLEKDGILEDRLIQHMWQGFLGQKEALVKLMAKFDLICEAPVERLQQAQQDGVDTEVSNATGKVVKKRYYVPSRLTSHCSPEEIAQIKSSTDFYVDFRGFLTDGLFHRLMARTVRWMRERDAQPVNLFYRHISLMVDEVHHALLEMLPPREATIKVTVFRGAVADSDHDGDSNTPPAPSAVKEVMDFVTETLDSLIQHWARRMEYDVRFTCPSPKCSKKKLLKDCYKGKSLKCGLHNIPTAAIKIKFAEWCNIPDESH
ncbi:ankyrin repeat and KH domain-containing protein mask-like [Strongylocentrotus purpuratus]|uniref:COR domain-containing protein n=1 Tax=Strongylocentrotus purpuratus TaxID=7668 RepID=A0A7M7P3U5_STRPU|nr:ankyrin repeat and KH domain-containing protein mask-like [Strongylocentrotus purpuratus]